jgi:hypothetical protein
MQWIKRNLFMVVGGVIALALLGFAGFYLFKNIQQEKSVTEQLDAATQKLETLAKRDPYPNPENIKSAKDEGKRLQGFLGDVEKHFQSTPYPPELNNEKFRTYLEMTRSELLADAQKAGVEVPTNYWFTFGAQKGAMTFSAASLHPLASQLADIKTICDVLFDAKINSLVLLRRVPVDAQDTLGSQDYLNAKPVTNAWSVTMPYEVTFQGFSSQLASVLEGLVRVPYCFVVTNLVVEPAAAAAAPTENPTVPSYPSRYMSPEMQRYGGRYGRYGPPPPVAVVAPQPTGPTTILDEKPLRFTLALQSIKLKPRK